MPSESPSHATLLLLLVLSLFVAGVYRCEVIAQELEPQAQPSTLVHGKPGAGASYDLLKSLGFKVARDTSPWTSLNSSSRLLIVLNPLSRAPVSREIAPLRSWVSGGGTLFLVCAGSPESKDPRDTVAGDVDLLPAKPTEAHLQPISKTSALCRNVHSIAVVSSLRIGPSARTGYEVLFEDNQGIVAAEKSLGKGHVILITDDLIASNSGIGRDDNAVFLTNVAAAAVGSSGKSVISFDEYHHGVGFEADMSDSQGKLLTATPLALKLIAAALCLFGVLYVYSGNQRTGPLVAQSKDSKPKLAADYVTAMSRIYSKSGATGLAVESLYSNLMRDLNRFINAPPGSTSIETINLTKSSGVNVASLYSIVERCEQSIAGVSISDNELLDLAAQIDQIRRELGVVGHQ